MKAYDFIITGAGAAGLSLAYRLITGPLNDRRILLIDKDQKQANDRTWCFWADRPTTFDPVVSHTWHQVSIINNDYAKVSNLEPYTYRMIRASDFYAFVFDELNRHPNVTFVQAPVQAITENGQGAVVTAGGQQYAGQYAFNSTFQPADFRPDPARYHRIMQHFLGWVIETPEDVFNPQSVTMFDFRTPQCGAMRFLYLLPFSTRHALVEYTLFSAQLLSQEEYQQGIRDYLRDVLQIQNYTIVETEQGIIPMTDMPFERRPSRHVLNIGTKGGRVKPSTGYSFYRTQKDTAAIVNSLQKYGHPFNIPGDSNLYRYLDSIMLNLMLRRGDDMAHIFTELFKNNSIQRIFRFLDEEAGLPEVLRVVGSVPPAPFLQAWLRLKVLRRL
jgi:lycopene beta-cyclase